MNNMAQHSIRWSLILHLLPGILGTIAYILLKPAVVDAGYPPLLALLIAAGAIILPLQLGYLYIQSQRGTGTPVIQFRDPLPKWQYIVFPFSMVIWAFLASGLLSTLDLFLAQSWFGWLPDWFFVFDLEQFQAFSRPALLTTFWAGLAINGLLGPIVEELYFRGHLLPRLARFGRWSPFLNITLFSLYHFWTPWQFFSRILWLLPWGYLVWKKRNFYLMMIAHCAGNTIGWLLTWGLILGSA